MVGMGDMIVIEGSQYGKSNTNDIMHVCANGKDWKGSRHVIGHDMKRRTSKVCLDYALVMIYAAVVALMFPFYPPIFFSSSTGSRVISGYVVSVLLSRSLRVTFQ